MAFLRQFGGLRLLKAYARKGLLWKAVGCFCTAVKKNSLTAGYARMSGYVHPILAREFEDVMNAALEDDGQNHTPREGGESGSTTDVSSLPSRKVWTCWLQGLDEAPEVVRQCIASQKRNIKDRDVVVLDETTIAQYVSLPADIEEKYRKGIIPRAHYSDMVRLELLYRYGGTWIDSTVLMMSDIYPNELFDSDFFLPQAMVRGQRDGHFHGVSNWFITARKGHVWLKVLREMLYAYWRQYDCLLDYYVMHLFVGMLAQRQPQVWHAIHPLWNASCLQLQEHLFDPYKAKPIEKLLAHTPMQKLTYKKISDEQARQKGTFYDVLVRGNAPQQQ